MLLIVGWRVSWVQMFGASMRRRGLRLIIPLMMRHFGMGFYGE